MLGDLRTVFARVRAALRHRGASSQDADDWTQEAWLRTAISGAAAAPNPEAYLLRTAINISIDACRLRQRHVGDANVDDVALVDRAPGVEEQVIGKERLDRVQQCLERMPARTREIFLAHRVDEKTHAEIGLELGISPKVVEKHVARALELLTGWMDGW